MSPPTDEAMDVEEETTKETTKAKASSSSPGTPSASSEAAAEYPKMELAQSIHRLLQYKAKKLVNENEPELEQQVQKQVLEELENVALYKELQQSLGWSAPTTVSLDELEAKHVQTLADLEQKVQEARENAGDMEILDARLEIARYAAKSCSQEVALEAYQQVVDLPKLSTGKTMDALMESARVASFYGNTTKTATLIEKALKLAQDGGDWDRRNRLKVYSALSKLLARNVEDASLLLKDCIATFSCTELCSYTDFLVYALISNILYLPRTELHKSILQGPEILSVQKDISEVFSLVKALHDCNYQEYMHAMVQVHPILVRDRFLEPHAGYLMRELHVLGYQQFLNSYKSVTLQSMATSFGVSSDYLDAQLYRFIAAGRLTAKIDASNGIVETNRPDTKNAQYKSMIQQGDLLLNRIQKLARVVDV